MASQGEIRAFANWTGTGPTFMAGMGLTSSTTGNARVVELDGLQLPWTNVQILSAFNVGFLQMFNGAMFVGLETFTAAEVHISTDGNSFTSDISNAGEGTYYSAEVFGSKLYAGTQPPGTGDTPVIRSRTTGGSWVLEETFLTSDLEVNALKVFGAFLYAAVSSVSGDARILRSSNGSTWTQVQTFTSRTNVSALEVFGGDLYALVWEDGVATEAHVTSDGTSWSLNTTFTVSGSGNMTTALTSDGTNLFAGLGNNTTDLAQLWAYDGATWGQSIDFNTAFTSPFGSVTGIGHDAVSNKIYAGVGDFLSGSSAIYVCPTADTPSGGGGG